MSDTKGLVPDVAETTYHADPALSQTSTNPTQEKP
jgi:hypothetical protein